MPATRNHLTTSAARADAVRVAVAAIEQPSARHVRLAIAAALRQLGDRGCAERVAQEFGDHPELAAARMRWARQAAARGIRRTDTAAAPPAAGRVAVRTPRRVSHETAGSSDCRSCQPGEPTGPELTDLYPRQAANTSSTHDHDGGARRAFSLTFRVTDRAEFDRVSGMQMRDVGSRRVGVVA